ncbi:DEAD/DEAH box helicase [Oleidesulfovibrio alaskensis]
MNTEIQHARGCLVSFNDKHYFVADPSDSKQEICISCAKTKKKEWVCSSKIKCGYRPGMPVRHVPQSPVIPSLGCGKVHQARNIGGRSQVLVEFPETNKLVWLPYERLAFFRDAPYLFERGIFNDDAEAFQLRCLAYALELWNENTGSLSHFEIDPLPHQIHLVYHILASGDLNWLIADDVGLGKTIEVGLLLSALKQRRQLNSVLLIAPAGLTRQWQEEMKHRFRIADFRIYGDQFQVDSLEDWRRYPFVIASIDRLKQDSGLQRIAMSEGWDLVVFDEAHRLTRNEYGKKFQSSQRYKLATVLRKKTESFVLLTATPHQGKQDQFIGLLELVRPRWKKEFRKLELQPELLREFVIRNDKADVTNAEGEFIFKGKNVRTLQASEDQAAIAFDKELSKYLRKGYAESIARGQTGTPIGFVMTVYRKLASSSAAAIHKALQRRLSRLDEARTTSTNAVPLNLDERFMPEAEEVSETDSAEFFEGERQKLESLIQLAAKLKDNDPKMDTFLNKVIPQLLEEDSSSKILIFTEYRTTQDYLRNKLNQIHGENSCAMINGSMDYREREREITNFEDHCSFLISTEAGGEGINLQKRCNIIVNYDLPWNPSRLLQRIGRLYRYGQDKVVFVLNISSRNSFDEKLVGVLYDRIDQVIHDMQSVGPEFREGLEDEILGSFIKPSEFENILSEAFSVGIERTEERISEALKKAKQAAEKQKDLFSYAQSYDPAAMQHEVKIGTKHLEHFAEKMFKHEGIDLVEKRRNGAIYSIKLPDELAENLGLKRRLDVTFDRQLARGRDQLMMLDIDAPLMRHLLSSAKVHTFGGYSAGIKQQDGAAILATVLRWQDSQGRRLRQEFTAVKSDNGNIEINSSAINQLLQEDLLSLPQNIARNVPQQIGQLISKELDSHLAKHSNANLHPESIQWIAGAWLGNPPEK